MENQLDMNITYLKGVGPKRAELYQKLGITSIGGLLHTYPRDYIDYTQTTPISQVVIGENAMVKGYVKRKLSPQIIRRGLTIYKLIVADDTADLVITIFNSNYAFDNLILGEEYILYGKVMGNAYRKEMSSPQFIHSNESRKILPIYPLTEGLSQAIRQKHIKTALSTYSKYVQETLPDTIRKEYSLSPLRESVVNIHFPKDADTLDRAKRRLVFDELLVLSLGLAMLRNRNRKLTGAKMHKKDLSEFYNSLPFKLTRAQIRSIDEGINDMCSNNPMNRLLQGDVGSGKTVVAAALCYLCFKNGYQSALMAPTEILATQHYNTLKMLLRPLGIEICLLTGSLTSKKKAEIKNEISSGKYSLIIGTHALIQQNTEFAKLGLVITDEQHRFGVKHRSMLLEKGENPHALVMSATPIPRTLALIIYGDLDISILDEMPKGRRKIETYVIMGDKRQRAYGFIKDKIMQGRQGYIVCPMIDEGENELASATKYANELSKGFFRNINVGLLHGKMPSAQKDDVMERFQRGEIDLLVSTTVIEVGIDVPNAVIIMIENAERFGLSQLHQLRGRVGRGEHQSFCILLTDNVSETNRKRLAAIKNTTDGFKIAEQDLKLRGPGDFFGRKQHGLPQLKIADMSQDMAVLKEAQELAHRILQEDSTLSANVNQPLLHHVRTLFISAEEYGFN
ncbi:MAG: ATP-dependent DNA helicase RecG [Clostridiales bacterium]|nr:ATP-dependent DNA helicase RecG [Clostridiales bacterium]